MVLPVQCEGNDKKSNDHNPDYEKNNTRIFVFKSFTRQICPHLHLYAHMLKSFSIGNSEKFAYLGTWSLRQKGRGTQIPL